jgi:hypothetical protein
MPECVIERAIPNLGASSVADLQAISQKSCGVRGEMGPEVHWVHSYLTGDKITRLDTGHWRRRPWGCALSRKGWSPVLRRATSAH